MASIQHYSIIKLLLHLNHSPIFNLFVKQSIHHQVIKSNYGPGFLIHVSLTKLFHLIPSLDCSLDRIMYILHSWQEYAFMIKQEAHTPDDFRLCTSERFLCCFSIRSFVIFFQLFLSPSPRESMYYQKYIGLSFLPILFVQYTKECRIILQGKFFSWFHLGRGGVLEHKEKLKI